MTDDWQGNVTTPQFWMHMQANFDLKAAMVRRRALKLAKRA